MIDVGLIGFGLGGKAFHAPVIASVPGLRLAAVLQRSSDSAKEIYPDVKIVRSIDELLSISSIKLVAISTPNDSHFPYAKACLEAGRDVVVDKPFTTTLAEAQELTLLSRKLGRLLTVYQDRRWDGDFQTLQQLLGSGEMGRIVEFSSTFDRCRPKIRDSWKEKPGPGNGIFFDLAPHLIDHALKLFGPPEELSADIRVERDGGVNDDAFDITFFYANGLRSSLSSSTLAPVPRPHFRVRGTKGMFVKQYLDPQEALLRSGHPVGGENWGVEKEDEWGTLTHFDDAGAVTLAKKIPTMRGDYRGFYENVRDVMLGKAQPAVTLTEAQRVMYALELCTESSRQREALPWVLREV